MKSGCRRRSRMARRARPRQRYPDSGRRARARDSCLAAHGSFAAIRRALGDGRAGRAPACGAGSLRPSSRSPRRSSSPPRSSTTSLDRLSRVSVGIDTGPSLTAAVSLSGASYAARQRPEGVLGAIARAGHGAARSPGGRRWRTAGHRTRRGRATTSISRIIRLRPARISRSARGSACPRAFFRPSDCALERGRLLDERSLQDDVVVVDRAWANRFFPGQEVLGRRFRSGGCTTCPWTTVVGVVGNVKWVGIDKSDRGHGLFSVRRHAQCVLRRAGDGGSGVVVDRPRGQAVRELDPGLALTEHRDR